MTVLAALFFIGLTVLHGYFYLCLLQSKSYRNAELVSSADTSLKLDAIAFTAALGLSLLTIPFKDYENLIAFLSLIPSLISLVVKGSRFKNAKLVFTWRVKVIISVYLALVVSVSVGVYFLSALYGAFSCMCICFVVVANGITHPFFLKKNRKYLKECKNKLQRSKALKIAITGSAGKTGVKNILYSYLSYLGKTYQTPLSYNTPLGISRAVEEMDDDASYFWWNSAQEREGISRNFANWYLPTSVC